MNKSHWMTQDKWFVYSRKIH